MINMIKFFRHTWVMGHSMTTRKYNTALSSEGGAKGWLHKCECGASWAR